MKFSREYGFVVLYSFLTWLIPFLLSFLFFNKNRKLVVREMVFKTYMILIGGITTAFMLMLSFKEYIDSDDYSIQDIDIGLSLVIGFTFLAVNLLLDVFTIMKMAKQSFKDYMLLVGLRYVPMVAYSVAMGMIVNNLK